MASLAPMVDAFLQEPHPVAIRRRKQRCTSGGCQVPNTKVRRTNSAFVCVSGAGKDDSGVTEALQVNDLVLHNEFAPPRETKIALWVMSLTLLVGVAVTLYFKVRSTFRTCWGRGCTRSSDADCDACIMQCVRLFLHGLPCMDVL